MHLFRMGKLHGYLQALDEHYYLPLIKEMGLTAEQLKNCRDGNQIDKTFTEGISAIASSGIFTDVPFDGVNQYPLIFEGAQGLGLDEAYGVMPYCTPSNTGLQNPIRLLNQLGKPYDLDIFYVSRTYSTRHGTGRLIGSGEVDEVKVPLPGHLFSPAVMKQNDTNARNVWQGSIRYAPLETDLICRRVNLDFYNATTEAPLDSNLTAGMFFTWADHLAVTKETPTQTICQRLAGNMGLPLRAISRGPSAKNVEYFPASGLKLHGSSCRLHELRAPVPERRVTVDNGADA